MERRRSRRIKIKLKAERISGDEKFGVYIENISETGIYMMTTPLKKHKKYIPGTDIDLKFQLNTGEIINLYCKVVWAELKSPPNGMTDSIGLEIIDPPSRYLEFVRELN
ncbi:MAG TPA: PilZ domain-containing protein [Candidatus Humimicrobiaceae bacterium]|nr:PilZ domain-containing protein [Candidatus Humimicrobiaceae bacterium]